MFNFIKTKCGPHWVSSLLDHELTLYSRYQVTMDHMFGVVDTLKNLGLITADEKEDVLKIMHLFRNAEDLNKG